MPRRRCPPVNGASVPNVYWRARQEGELKEHARYLALPRPGGEKALARPAFLPQTSQAWREARRGVVTTSRLPGLLGYHEPNEGMQKLLHLPRYSVDATKLDGDAEALRADAAPPHGAAVAPYDPKDAADAILRENSRKEGQRLRTPGHADLNESQIAACVQAAAVSAGEVACLWGKAQEPAALLAVLELCPNAVVFEVGMLEVPHERVERAVSDAGEEIRFGASPDGVLCWDMREGPGGEAAAALSRAYETALRKAPKRILGDPAASAIKIAAAKALGGIDTAHVAMAPIEVKCRCPFYAGAARTYHVNHEQTPQARLGSVAPTHYPQVQLECAALGTPGGLLVYHTAASGTALYWCPSNPAFVDDVFKTAAATLSRGRGGADEAELRRSLARRARAGVQKVCMMWESRGLAGAADEVRAVPAPSAYFTESFLPVTQALKRVLHAPWSFEAAVA